MKLVKWFKSLFIQARMNVRGRAQQELSVKLQEAFDADKTPVVPNTPKLRLVKDDSDTTKELVYKSGERFAKPEPIIPFKSKVHSQKTEWEPDVKKFGYGIRAHQNILRPAATIFDDYKKELGKDYGDLKDFIFTVDDVFSIIQKLSSTNDPDMYKINVMASCNRIKNINQKLSIIDKRMSNMYVRLETEKKLKEKQLRKKELESKKIKRLDNDHEKIEKIQQQMNKLEKQIEEYENTIFEIKSLYKPFRKYVSKMYIYLMDLKKTKAYKG